MHTTHSAIKLLRTSPSHPKATYAELANNTNDQGVLRWVCGKRSHGWRSARIETGCLVEGKADLALCAMHTAKFSNQAIAGKLPALRKCMHIRGVSTSMTACSR